jgi:hypothetical protein
MKQKNRIKQGEVGLSLGLNLALGIKWQLAATSLTALPGHHS